ncbi:helix-turn-helix transcriptional regulator [Vibrio maerlii]|uniref:helix-turn-helix transcriptional regulator n=1 Tax=Vibrio maerlii TaxID=2231648 RepID=UPI000E3DCD4B|nr:helix-turn-helix transcriptional regulator [Vibrio maerlii]
MEFISDRSVHFDKAEKINLSYRQHIRKTLKSVGVEHVALSVSPNNKSPYYLEVTELGSKIKFASRAKAIEILEKYSKQARTADMKRGRTHVLNRDIWVNYFCGDELIIRHIHPHLYIYRVTLDCDTEVTLHFHSLKNLLSDALDTLQNMVDIVEKWVVSWLAHQRLLYSLANIGLVSQEAEMLNLTNAEHEVLSLMLRGFTSNEIAAYRQVSKETVRSQIKSLLHKTNSHSQNELIASHSHFNQLCYSLFD